MVVITCNCRSFFSFSGLSYDPTTIHIETGTLALGGNHPFSNLTGHLRRIRVL